MLSGGSMEKGEKTQSWPGTTQIDRKLSVCTQRVHIASRLAENPCFKFVFGGSLEKGTKNNHGREPARSTGNCRFVPKGFRLQADGLETIVLSLFLGGH